MAERSIILHCGSCDAKFRADYAPGQRLAQCPRCHQKVGVTTIAVDRTLKSVIGSNRAQRRSESRGL